MALNAGTVQAFATLNDKGFESGINNLKKKGERFSKDMQQNFDKIGRSLTSIGSKMTMAISTPLIGAGTLAVKTAANYETLRTSMDILNGSVEEGARNFERLKEFSAQTPFQLDELAKAQNMLQGFGMEADDAYKSIKMIGDISAVSGGSIEGIGIAFGQAAAEGKLMTMDIRQLINQGVPAIKLLADTMGVAQNEIFDLASQGKISFDILVQAFEEATSEGGMFADGMKKQAQTIGGVFSTLKDNVNLALGELGQTIVEELDLKRVIGDLISNIQAGVTWFASLSSAAKRFTVIGAGVAAAIGPTILAIGATAKAMSGLMLILPKVVAGIKLLTATMIANPYLAVGAAIAFIAVKAMNAVRATKQLNEQIKNALTFDITAQSLKDINEIISDTEEKLRKMEKTAKQNYLDNEDIVGYTELNKKLDELKAKRADIAMGLLRKELEETQPEVKGTKEAVEQLTNSYKDFSVAIKQVNDTPIMEPAEIDRLYRAQQAAEGLYTPLSKLMDIELNIGEKMFPPGSLGYLQESLANLQEQLRIATDPEVIERIKNEMNLTQQQIDQLTGSTEQGGQALMGLANSIGMVFSQAVLHAQNLEDVLKNLLKQLASKAFVVGIGALLTGGASLGGGSFFSALFGGLFHGGGIVQGSGDKMIRAKGGEMVLTKSQQKALNMGGGQSTSINPSVFAKAIGYELDKRLQRLSEGEIYAMSQRGRRAY